MAIISHLQMLLVMLFHRKSHRIHFAQGLDYQEWNTYAHHQQCGELHVALKEINQTYTVIM